MTSKVTAQDRSEFSGYLRNCTDSQVKGVWEKEAQAGRRIYTQLAADEAARRGISTADWVKPGRRTFEDTLHA